jgi:hypothetical protein
MLGATNITKLIHILDRVIWTKVNQAAWIKSFELFLAGLGSCELANMILSTVEVLTNVFDCNNILIKQCDLFGSCQY